MMTTDAKKALAKTIRALRAQLLDELGEALEQTYKLSIADAKKAKLTEAQRVGRARLESWIGEQVRGVAAKHKVEASKRFRDEVVKDAAATLLLRLVYLRLLEESGLREVKVLTGGWESRGYLDFREVAAELRQGDPTEGYAALLQLVFDELALDLPGLFGPVRMTALVPVPAKTWRAVVTELNDPELASVWDDDTTLGWVYQYWNDPEREELDKKLASQKKLENHEIASKTQMFTERYMVEWLLHNSLGQIWLAMCKKHGWVADVERLGVLDDLERRRADWRAKREAGEVALDALMPIADGLEDRWKYWVPQPMPDDAVANAPASVRELKILDPACGSGHFLVIAMGLLFALYQEEARHRGESWTERDIVESIIERNLHGIDIDPRAVQIAAAAVMLKARQLCADVAPRTMNLVAPSLRLAALPADDPAKKELLAAVEKDTGMPPALTNRLLEALAGADHLGTLLKVDTAINDALAEWEGKLTTTVPTRDDQGSLFTGYKPRRTRRLTPEAARATVLDRLERFLDHHSSSADLGLRLRGEQLAAGVRFLRLVKEGQYDLVVANPPYQGTSKMADKAYVEKHYPRGKADLYAAFLERGLQLVKDGGTSAMLTMRNWMFLTQYTALRTWLIETYDLRALGDVDRGAFDEVPNEVLAAAMSIIRRTPPATVESVAMQPTPLDDKSYDRERTKRKRAAVLCQLTTFNFSARRLVPVPSRPILYWWSDRLIDEYARFSKLSDVAPAKEGLGTRNDSRFLRRWHEVPLHSLWCERLAEDREPCRPPADATWVPNIKGSDGRRWCEPLSHVVAWKNRGFELKVWIEHYRLRAPGQYIRNEDRYFQAGVAFSAIGHAFSARMHMYRSIFGAMGPSVFGMDRYDAVALLNKASSRAILQSFNPGIHFQTADVNRLPVVPIPDSKSMAGRIESAFWVHESAREPSIEFHRPGPSPWDEVVRWADELVEDPDGEPPPPHADSAPLPADYVSFALGATLGRFGRNGEGILADAPPTALPNGILFLSEASEQDSLTHPACASIHAAWADHGHTIDPDRTLKDYLREKFFPDVHRKMYENRPIYFPLSSAKKSFVAYISIHRWNEGTLRALLAEHLYIAKRDLESELPALREARAGADKKAARAAEKRFTDVDRWMRELNDFIALVEQCAERRPPRPDDKTPDVEQDARYVPDLDDGVMINSAALWPLLEPQWKDPKKWWKELASAQGKKDYDWSHLAARYFPRRVDAKCQVDPSLAVAHGCFWKYHPEKAYQWELRLQDEIRPDFTIDEADSDAARAAFRAAHPDKVAELEEKERKRRLRKQADRAEEPQAELDLDEDADEAEQEADA